MTPGAAARRWSEEDLQAALKRMGKVRGVTAAVIEAGPPRERRVVDARAQPVSNPAPSPFRSKLESAYAGYLHVLMLAGDILTYRHEPFRLHLAVKTTYTPDFLVIMKDGSFEIHETKGFARDDAMVKLKVAARLYPWWKFVLVKRKRGVWDQRELPT